MASGAAIPGKGQIVIDYLRKYKSASSYKIADLLARDYPDEFSSIENARTNVRYYRGSQGDEKRRKLNPDNYVPRFTAPKSDEKESAPYIIPDESYPIIMAGDVHVPYHDPDALETCIEYAIDIRAKTFVMMGDWLDFYQVSRWMKDPRKRDLKSELAMFNELLDSMQAAMPDTKLIFKCGNHEFRLDSYILQNAPQLFGLDEIKLKNLLHLDRRGIDFVDHMQVIRYKHLNIIHGHEYVFSISNPVNPARGLYNRAKKNTICFHHHQSSSHSEKDISGDVTTCWSSGCLCNLSPEYMPFNKWNHGFIEINGDDDMFQVKNHNIINYKVV